jgi:hypothetical protein
MRNSTSLVIIMALLSASALGLTGTYFIDNFCPFPMYLQSSSTPVGCPVPPLTLPANTSNTYSEIMRDDKYSTNTLTLSPDPSMGVPIQALYYQEEQSMVFALSTMFGDPLKNEGFQLLLHKYGTGVNCPPRSFRQQTCPYTTNAGHQVYNQNKEWGLRLTLCQFNQTGSTNSVSG